MKKIIIAMLALSLSVSLVACSGSKDSAQSSEASQTSASESSEKASSSDAEVTEAPEEISAQSSEESSAVEESESSVQSSAVEETSGESSEAEAGLISQYIDKGYTWRSYSTDNNEIKVVLGAEDDSDFVMITVPLTEEEISANGVLNVFDEDYKEQEIEWLKSISGEGTVTSMMDKIPSQGELDKLIGKTGAELEEMDYTIGGFDNDQEGLCFSYSYYISDENDNDTLINIDVWFDGTDGMTSDDVSDEVLADLVVSKVQFASLG